MMLPSLATLEDLEARLDDLPNREIARAEAALSDASTLVRTEVGLTWVDADGELTTVPDVAVMVTLQCARRAFVGEVFRGQDLEGTPFVESAIGRPLYLSKSEKAALATITGNSSLFSVDVTRGDLDYFNAAYIGAEPDSDGLVPFITEPWL